MHILIFRDLATGRTHELRFDTQHTALMQAAAVLRLKMSLEGLKMPSGELLDRDQLMIFVRAAAAD